MTRQRRPKYEIQIGDHVFSKTIVRDFISLNKIYEVIDRSPQMVFIIDDSGDERGWSVKKFFKCPKGENHG